MCSSLLLTINNAGAMGAMTFRGGDGALCVSINNSPVKGFYYQNPGTIYQSDNYFSEQFSLVSYTYYSSVYNIEAPYGKGIPLATAASAVPSYNVR
jgi:hypothetical protein